VFLLQNQTSFLRRNPTIQYPLSGHKLEGVAIVTTATPDVVP
jgi:hypothetical protein